MMAGLDASVALIDRLRMLGRPDLVRHLINLFLNNILPCLRDAREAGAAEDWTGVKRAAHLLKSSGTNLGLSRVIRLARELEDRASRGDVQGIPSLLTELEGAYFDARRRLEGEREDSMNVERESHA